MLNRKKTRKGTRIKRQFSLVALASLSLIVMVNTVSWAGEAVNNFVTVNIEFQPPGSEVPRRALGGGSRGNINFMPNDDKAPTTAKGGGARGDISFIPNDDKAPTTARGGGARGDISFIPNDDKVPTSARGGGSREGVGFMPSGDTPPENTKGGGSRNDSNLLQPAALLPNTNIGWTGSERPTFFVYIPPTSESEVFFSLYSEDRQQHYQTTFQLKKTGGIVAIKLPAEAPALSMNKPYQWSVILLKPGEMLRPDAYSISGWVKRVSAPVTPETLKGKNPGESQRAIALAALYAKSGIWYDTLNILNQARLTQPENLLLKKEWADLLKQVGLEHLAQESLTEQL
ncbi:MAG: DUF928 domain-containing protein (plasmid) [Phormidium sp.]